MESLGACAAPAEEPTTPDSDVVQEGPNVVEEEIEKRGGTGAFCSASTSASMIDLLLMAALFAILVAFRACTRRQMV